MANQKRRALDSDEALKNELIKIHCLPCLKLIIHPLLPIFSFLGTYISQHIIDIEDLIWVELFNWSGVYSVVYLVWCSLNRRQEHIASDGKLICPTELTESFWCLLHPLHGEL